MAMTDSQRDPLNLYLINNGEDIVVFLGLKVFHSEIFFPAVEFRHAGPFCRKPTIYHNQVLKMRKINSS